MPTKLILVTAIFAVIAYVLYTKTSVNSESSNLSAKLESAPNSQHNSETHLFELESKSSPSQDTPAGALENERIVNFSSAESMEAFLASLNGSNIEILGQSKYSNTLRVGFSSYQDLAQHLPTDATTLYNFPVTPPPIENGSINPNVVPFNGRMMEWMGITSDNSQWGAGVSVAVLDTGLLPHPAFGDDVQSFSLAGDPNHPDLDSHGTAMASLWRSADGNIPAIAPAVDLMSIQISDDTGSSDLFTLAEAIYFAVDQGAQLIPISMGTTSTNSFLDGAIAYATDNGALIIASAGNSGEDTLYYPAAYPETLSIAAIDYNRNHPGFSNTGETLTLTAPGVGVITAGENQEYTLSSGTSPAAQIAGNVIAATMSELEINDPLEAWELIADNLNELGVAGQDTLFGLGYPQLDVILNYDQSGRYDAAIASTLFVSDPQTNSGEMQIVVSNPGTEDLFGATLDFEIEGNRYSTPLPSISAGESHNFTVPLPLPSNTDVITVNSQVTLPEGQNDVRPRDNGISARFSIGN